MTRAPALRDIRILHLEDDPADAFLVKETLSADAIDAALTRVQSREEFVRALEGGTPDLILADYNLPAFDGLSALDIVRARDPILPFILVSGTIGEERAAEVLKRGATDYVLKDRISKLPNAVRRALAEAGERKRLRDAEAALRESEARLREIAVTLQEAFWILSPEADRVLYVSPAFEKIWGRPSAEVLGKSPAAILESIHPEDRARVESDFRRLPQGEHAAEIRILRPGGEVRRIRSRSYPVRDAAGRVLRIIGSSEDVTDQRRAEEQLHQAQKMESLGQLSGGVAHDFNNLLTIISGYTQIVLETLEPADPRRSQVQEILAAAARASSLTRQLLAFSRKQILQPRALNLNGVVGNMEKMLRRLIGENVRLVTRLDPRLKRIKADPGQMEQVIMNLAVNARDAMPKGGTLTLETSGVTLDENYARAHAEVTPGPYVMLAVTDTGTGMDAATRARLFEPFFTTKEIGKGTGIGLSTVYGIVKQGAGHIGVCSEPGRGTVFKVCFPPTDEEGSRQIAAPAAPAAPAARGSETILVVEDDASIRLLVRQVLTMQGYTVIEAGDGHEAERVFRGHLGTIHLLLTDSVLPGASGPEIARLFKSRRPEMRVLFMSGYTQTALFEESGLGDGQAFLSKPFRAADILKAVRNVLDGTTS